MDITRREFLGYGVAAGALSHGLLLPSPLPVHEERGWLVLPVPRQCSLPESASGYGSALPPGRQGWRCSLVIIPAVLDLPPEVLRHLGRFLRQGTTVIIESGAGFADHLNYRQHRRVLREYLQLDVQAPVDLWSGDSRSRTPYVDYTWPYSAKVRDFSRVVPLADQAGEIIAWAGDLPVGLRRRCERGTLIYLGSPLGPALWAGDAEAKRWLLALLA